jgi:oligopeptide/dipeptide ABC transporter ATP-binding protein
MAHDRLLDVQDLTIQYNIEGNLVPVVDRVSFYIEPGEIIGLVGESGCGKTQVALAQAGLLAKQAKVIESNNNILNTAMIFQDPLNALNPVLKVGKQILEGIRNKEKVKSKKEEVISLLEQVGIDEPKTRYDQYPHEFSGGMRQRALIAMALAQEPDLLIADEPTTALDVTIQGQIIDLLKELNRKKGLSILFISHDLTLVRPFANRTMVMYAGKIVETGPNETIFSSPKHPYTRSLLKVAGLEKDNDGFIAIKGSVPDPRNYPKGCPFHPRCDVVKNECFNKFPETKFKNNHSWNCVHD